MNVLVSQKCEIRFNDIIDRGIVHMYSNAKIQNMADLQIYALYPYLFIFLLSLILWISVCDKKNLAFVDFCDNFY